MKTMTILGSTGSIGTQALEVAAKHNIKVKALAANSDVEKLAAQSKELLPERVCIYREDKVRAGKASQWHWHKNIHRHGGT